MVLIMSSGQGLALDFIRVIVRVTSRGTVCSMIKRLTGIWQLGYPVRKFEGPVGIGLMHRVLKEGRACSCVELRDWGWFLFEFFFSCNARGSSDIRGRRKLDFHFVSVAHEAHEQNVE